LSDHSSILSAARTTEPAAVKEVIADRESVQTEFNTLPLHAMSVQFKLSVGAPDDPLEREADAMADKIMRMPFSSPPYGYSAGNGTEVVRRKCSECEPKEEKEKVQRKPLVSFIQRQESSGAPVASEALSNRINSSRGGGSNLDNPTQSFMQSRFGADFTEVKIHTGGEATQMNRELNAKAFTVGNDIYFNQGQYNPGSKEGAHLLAHELTHTLQQSGGIERKIQRKPGGNEKITYQFKVPEGITTTEQWGKYLNKKIYGDENAATWTYGESKIFPGQIRYVTISAGSLAENTDSKQKEEHEKKKSEFDTLPPGPQKKINSEADKRFYNVTGDKEGTKIKPGDKGKANTWNQIRDDIMSEKQTLESLPEEVKQLMGGKDTFQPSDYTQLLRISEKLKQFSAEDLSIYKMLALRATDNLDLFEQSVDLFLARKKQLEKAMKDMPPPAEDKKEPASVQEAIDDSWKDFDSSQLSTMSEDEKGSLARKRAWEVTKAQLNYMKDHAGKTALDFAKTATLANTGDTFRGIAEDLKEAAKGDANGYARWAGGTGAGAKLSGWLLAVGAIVYVLSWLTGVGELATIAAFMGYMLGATLVLSTAEAELRIKAASQAKTPEEFKAQATKAGIAYSNVLIGVALLIVALAIRFLAKTFFPGTLKNISESLARFREKVRISGGLKEALPAFESEMSGFRKKLVESGETAKQEAAARADSIEKMSTDDFVKNLEAGTDDFFSNAGVKEGQKVPWAELAKTPEGLKGIQEYQKTLVQELRAGVPKEIDAAVKEQLDAMDRMLENAKKSTTPDEFDKATSDYEKFNSPEEVAKRGKAKEDQVRKEQTEEAVKKIDEEIKKAEAERKAAEEKRKAEEAAAKKAAEEEKARIQAEEDAKVAAIKKTRTEDPAKRKEELAFDLDTKKARPREGEVAFNTEEGWGYFDRFKAPPGKKGDWVSVSGKNKGQTFDHFGLPDKESVIKSNAALNTDGSPSVQRVKFFESLDEHFRKADHVILDIEAVKVHLPAFYNEIMAYIDATYGRAKLIEYK
jgi:predicted phage tail protein